MHSLRCPSAPPCHGVFTARRFLQRHTEAEAALFEALGLVPARPSVASIALTENLAGFASFWPSEPSSCVGRLRPWVSYSGLLPSVSKELFGGYLEGYLERSSLEFCWPAQMLKIATFLIPTSQ